jgi:stalled ribosome rescue protein Dom34
MANPHHVAVWLDHKEARVFHVTDATFEEATLRDPQHHLRRDTARQGADGKHPEDPKAFFRQLAATLDGAEEVLIVGPSFTKLQFIKFAHAHDPKLAEHIVGVESADHPTDPQIVAHARHYFRGVDRMLGLTP